LPRPSARAGTRAGALIVITAWFVLGTAAVAQAHVQVRSDTNIVGSDATLTFRIPTESATASTVKVVVTLPSDPPLLSVSPQDVPGWTAAVTLAPLARPVVVGGTTLTKAPHQVTWTATSGGIPPEQFAELALLVENLPDARQLSFPTEQYYSDGTVVSWDQPHPAGQPEPDHPVPSLQLVLAAAQTGGGDGVARGLGAAALAVAVLALGVAARRARPRPGPAAP
jgi:uncharacterized protein YcnI